MGKRQRRIAFLHRLLIGATLRVPFRLVRMGKRQRRIAFLHRLLIDATLRVPKRAKAGNNRNSLGV